MRSNIGKSRTDLSDDRRREHLYEGIAERYASRLREHNGGFRGYARRKLLNYRATL